MAENQDLLDAVLAAPDADEPRLAYAAWCERQTDEATQARSVFIRAHIALANAEKGITEANTFALRSQAETLVDRYGSLWAAPLANLVAGFEYDRGFVELITISAARFLEHAADLFRLAPIRHLTLTDVAEVAEALFASPHLKTIRSLKMKRCDLTDAHASMLAASPVLDQLRWLSIAENAISFEGADALAASTTLPHLAYVHFYGNPVNPSEQFAYDGEIIMDAWLPEDGERLEARHGYLPWLHQDATTAREVFPDRFRLGS